MDSDRLGLAEHIFNHEDVHWGPGYSADTWWEMERRMEGRKEEQANWQTLRQAGRSMDTGEVLADRQTGRLWRVSVSIGAGWAGF